jgi:hypothetical protein
MDRGRKKAQKKPGRTAGLENNAKLKSALSNRVLAGG